MATWRANAAGCGAAGGEQRVHRDRRTPRRCAPGSPSRWAAARLELGIEAGEDLAGELGGDGAAGEGAEGDHADQRALERADVLRRRGRRSARARPASTSSRPSWATRLRRIVRRVARSAGVTSQTRPASKRSRRRSSSASMSRGRRSEVSTSWAPAWCSQLKVWKNSCSVLALLGEELDVVDEQDVDAAVGGLEGLDVAAAAQRARRSGR